MSGRRPGQDPSDPAELMPVWVGRATLVLFGLGTVVFGAMWLSGDASGEVAFWTLVAFLAAVGLAVQRRRDGHGW